MPTNHVHGFYLPNSEPLVVSDPCYAAASLTILRPFPGRWTAKAITGKDGRVSSLYAEAPYGNRWSEARYTADVGVDSGQMYIGKQSAYRNDADTLKAEAQRLIKGASPDDVQWLSDLLANNGAFYTVCCSLTTDRDRPFGNVDGRGVVSASGWGDGEYKVYTCVNEYGLTTGIKVKF